MLLRATRDGLLQNWNHQCAECHVTDVRKGYVAATGDVRHANGRGRRAECEACHGPGSRHAERARRPATDGARPTDSGLLAQLSASTRMAFAFNGNDPIAHPQGSAPPAPAATTAAAHREVEACGQCHARRGTLLAQHEYGKPLADTHRVALLEPSLYFADGQMQDEVFNYGSFLQSRMGRRRCDARALPRTALRRLRAEDAVCAQCHQAATFDTPQHRGHAGSTAATQCTTCHMPARTYMVVDPRHDHGFRRPNPPQSAAVGAPARSARPSANAAMRAGQRLRSRAGTGRARIRADLRGRCRRRAAGPAARCAAPERSRATRQPPIVRASALRELNAWAAPPLVPLLRATLLDPDPLVREAAAAWLEIVSWTGGSPRVPGRCRIRCAACGSRPCGRSPRWASRPGPHRSRPGSSAALEEYRASLQIDADRVEGQGRARIARDVGRRCRQSGSAPAGRIATRSRLGPGGHQSGGPHACHRPHAQGEQVLRAADRLDVSRAAARTRPASCAHGSCERRAHGPRTRHDTGPRRTSFRLRARSGAARSAVSRRRHCRLEAPSPANLEALAAWHAERGDSPAAGAGGGAGALAARQTSLV